MVRVRRRIGDPAADLLLGMRACGYVRGLQSEGACARCAGAEGSDLDIIVNRLTIPGNRA